MTKRTQGFFEGGGKVTIEGDLPLAAEMRKRMMASHLQQSVSMGGAAMTPVFRPDAPMPK